MDLKDFSSVELQDELIRRDKEERLANKPHPLEEPDLEGLKRIVAEYIESIYDGTYYNDSDIDNYIIEVAVKTIYGNDIFHWINKNIQ